MKCFNMTLKNFLLVGWGCVLFMGINSCATINPVITNDTPFQVNFGPSEFHKFRSVRVVEVNDQVLLYGKVDHSHSASHSAEHIDVVIYDVHRTQLISVSLPLVDRGNRRKGWFGAHFRYKMSQPIPPKSLINLAFHEPDNYASTFDCGDNKALHDSEVR